MDQDLSLLTLPPTMAILSIFDYWAQDTFLKEFIIPGSLLLFFKKLQPPQSDMQFKFLQGTYGSGDSQQQHKIVQVVPITYFSVRLLWNKLSTEIHEGKLEPGVTMHG